MECDRRYGINWKKEHEDLASKWSAICVGWKWCKKILVEFVCVVLFVEYKCAWE
jgi:hypothetical protein